MKQLNQNTIPWLGKMQKLLLASVVLLAFSFTTMNAQSYCEPEGTNSGRYIDNFSATGDGDQEIDNQGSGFSDGGYGDHTDMVVSVNADSQVNFDAGIEGGTAGFRIWVDWNNDGNFDIEEEVAYQSSGYSANHEGSFDIPGDADGDYRMRIVSHWLSTSGDVDPCETGFSYGEFEDYTVSVAPVDCLSPSDLEVTEITVNSATISWEEAFTNPDTYEYAVTTEDEEPEDADDTVDGTSVDLTDLDSNTTYYVWIRSDCGTDGKSSWRSVSFKTACGTMNEMFEDFEDYDPGNIVPDCWERMEPETSSGTQTISSTSPASGEGNIYQYTSSTSNSIIVVLPKFSNIDAGTHWLRLQARVGSGAPGSLSVGYVTDVSDYSSFTTIEDLTITNSSYGDESEYTLAIPTSVPDNARLAIKNDNDAKSYYWDDVYWEEAPSCLAPNELDASDITLDSADINWTELGTATEWEVTYGEAGFDVENEGESITVEDDSNLTLTDLTPNTGYHVYVSAICDENDVSTLIGPLNFFTLCTASDLPFTQDFEGVTTPEIPNCAELETNNGEGWETDEQTAYGFDSNVLRHKYTNYGAGPVDAWYFTQGINLEAGVDYQISYLYGSNSSTLTEKLKVAYGSSPTSSDMTEELTDDEFTFSEAQENEINFSVDTDGVYYFGFQSHADENQYWLYLDDIHIDLAPTCLAPTDLVAEEITSDSADISWTAGDAEEEWEVLYGEAGFDTGEEGESVTVNDNPETTLENLDSGTSYDVYVRTVCAEDDKSDWGEPASFTTEISCPAPSDLAVDNITESSAELTWTTDADQSDIYLVESGESAPDESSTPTESGVNSPITLDNLTDASPYEVYVRADCGAEDGMSEWEGPLSFMTSCVPGSIPFNEGFEDSFADAEVLGGCWSQESLSGTGQWIVMNEDGTYGRTSRTGDSYISLVYGEDDWIFYPLELTGETTYELSFYARQDATSGADVMASFGTENSAADMTTEIIPTTEVVSSEYEEFSGEFTPDSDGVYYIGIKGTTTYTPWYLTIDDISVTETETAECDAPTDLTVDVLSPTFAQVNWSGNAGDYEIAWGVSPYQPGDEGGSQFTTGDLNSYSIGVEPDTEYDVYVRAICDDEYSVWIDTSFTTPEGDDCQAPSGITIDNITENGAEITWTPANDGDDQWEISFAAGTQTPDEGTTDVVSGTPSYTATNLDPDTAYSVYLKTICSDEVSSDWAYNGFFQTLEGTGTVDCEAPTDVEVTNITDTTAEVSWSAVAEENQWEVLYGETGFDTDTQGNSEIVDVVTIYNITELDPETEYDVYVRSVCGEDDMSDWTGPITFTTEEEPVEDCEAPTDVEVSDITDTTAVVTWTPQGDEASWGVIYGETGFSQENEDDYQTDIVLAPTHTLDELLPETDYDVYVYAICDEEEMIYSDQVGPITFLTDELSVDSQEFNNFTFYPNPVEEQLSLKAGTQIDNVQVFNLLGQNVLSVQPNSLDAQINTDALQAGVYLMNVSINGSQKTFRIVKK